MENVQLLFRYHQFIVDSELMSVSDQHLCQVLKEIARALPTQAQLWYLESASGHFPGTRLL